MIGTTSCHKIRPVKTLPRPHFLRPMIVSGSFQQEFGGGAFYCPYLMTTKMDHFTMDPASFVLTTAALSASGVALYLKAACFFWSNGELPQSHRQLGEEFPSVDYEEAIALFRETTPLLFHCSLIEERELKLRQHEAKRITQKPRKPSPYPPLSEWRKIREEVFLRDGSRCTYCASDGGGFPLHCDHILAVSKGGKHETSNLTTSCIRCNASKGNLSLEEWRARR